MHTYTFMGVYNIVPKCKPMLNLRNSYEFQCCRTDPFDTDSISVSNEKEIRLQQSQQAIKIGMRKNVQQEIKRNPNWEGKK